jgi:hypothetical protein
MGAFDEKWPAGRKEKTMRKAILMTLSITVVFLLTTPASAQKEDETVRKNNLAQLFNCEDSGSLCAEREDNFSYDPEYKGKYIGHDEPAVAFYSSRPGSGNFNVYIVRLPKDPPKFPTDPFRNGAPLSATVWNFQQHPSFWFGMAMCDTQSFPLATNTCTPDSDSNIFDNGDPTAPAYIGKHPGTAFMEFQFYPPGWIGTSCDNAHWCMAITIDSLSRMALGPTGPVDNNADCLSRPRVGVEPVNFAYVTTDGRSQAPADPLNIDFAKFLTIPGKTFLVNPGDVLVVILHDTPEGFQVIVGDATTSQIGWMTASVANGFAQVNFNPTASTCTSTPYAFRPMYATSSEHTRVPWAAHSFNVGFSDEIGHFEYCDATTTIFGTCTSSPVPNESDVDDTLCVDGATALLFGAAGPLGGCQGSDTDFDAVSYHNSWVGTDFGHDPYVFSAVPEQVIFTSPKFQDPTAPLNSPLLNYDRVAFEADMLATEKAQGCDTTTGLAPCHNPPPGALFYPIFSTLASGAACLWQEGGPSIPGTTNNFGGSSATEFSTTPEQAVYISGTSVAPSSQIKLENYRQIFSSNPCTW